MSTATVIAQTNTVETIERDGNAKHKIEEKLNISLGNF